MKIRFTNEFLNKYANRLCLCEFNKSCHCTCFWNSRLRTSCGRFVCQSIGTPTPRNSRFHIELNKRFIKLHPKLLRNVVGHELTHYVCFISGCPFRDGNRFFSAELRRHHFPARLSICDNPKYYVYYCPVCFNIILTLGKLRDKYLCSHCYQGVFNPKFEIRFLGRFKLRGCYSDYNSVKKDIDKLALRKLKRAHILDKT